ncbi:hypothetical protein NPIL_703621 [Nephila pilipes]|uniref:Uncharacterized protein n=1 Tax=Nephila pilipes TaxID=299642 RepID=A0A8X6MV69_NEPPI|nr:hypothetical protein NPIL_703621 [Nephila pilipes]
MGGPGLQRGLTYINPTTWRTAWRDFTHPPHHREGLIKKLEAQRYIYLREVCPTFEGWGTQLDSNFDLDKILTVLRCVTLQKWCQNTKSFPHKSCSKVNPCPPHSHESKTMDDRVRFPAFSSNVLIK